MQEYFNIKKLNVIKVKIDVANTGHITNCYVIWDTNNNAVVIDPAFDADKIVQVIQDNNLKIKAIFLTHCHADHIAALNDLLVRYNVDAFIHKTDLQNINDEQVNCKNIVNINMDDIDIDKLRWLYGNETIQIGKMSFSVINTPGHTKGSIVIYEKNSHVLFTGDTIFENSYGRTDLKTGSHSDMEHSLNYLFDNFENVKCFPGHGNTFNIDEVKRKIKLLFLYKG